MQDQYNLSSVMVVRREKKTLPSIKGHIFRAIGIILIAISVSALLFATLKDPKDAIATGKVQIDVAPLPAQTDVLDVTAQIYPDLLDGVVAQGENPTERLDALGNPIGNPARTENSLAGAEKVTVIRPRAAPTGTSTRTILIDGQPLDGSVRRSPLPQAPIAGLSRTSPFGPLPQKGSNGERPSQAYARPFNPAPGKSTVSIIVGGLGIDTLLTQRAINELPPNVTLSFAAHAQALQSWINKARAAGHEVLIELPMESEAFNTDEPGAKNALRTDNTANRNIRNLDFLMAQGHGYFAVTNYNGDKLLQRADVLAPILAHISDSGVGFIFDGSTQARSLSSLASSVNIPFAQAFTLIDTIPERSSIETEFLRLEAQATSGSTPIGVGFAYADTFDAIKAWSSSLEGKNLQLAPASYALKQN